jgi:hypothetical protein
MKIIFLTFLIPSASRLPPLEILGIKKQYYTSEKINYTVQNKASNTLFVSVALEVKESDGRWLELAADATTKSMKTALIYKIKGGQKVNFTYDFENIPKRNLERSIKLRLKLNYGVHLSKDAKIVYSNTSVCHAGANM